MILLAILAVIGVAAVRLGSQERVNASAKGKRDMLVACANAARIALWTDLTRNGTGFLKSSSPPSTITLPDGTTLTAPAAPSGSPKDGLPMAELVEVTPMHTIELAATRSFTNTIMSGDFQGNAGGNGFKVVARCRDPKGRELLVELALKFAL
jgi:hypothetical protein